MIELMKKQKEVIEKIESHSSFLLPDVRPKDIQCPVCGTNFKSPATLKKHMIKSHKLENRSQCEMCDLTFVSSVVLKKHISTVHKKTKEGKKDFKCSMCESVFHTSWELGQHSRYVHKKERNIECKFNCGKTYSTTASMSSHLSSCTKNPNFVRKVCLYKGCDKSYTKQCDLNAHMKKAHGWEKKKGKGK
jgi:KRAB domain-containing zinc finger protein